MSGEFGQIFAPIANYSGQFVAAPTNRAGLGLMRSLKLKRQSLVAFQVKVIFIMK